VPDGSQWLASGTLYSKNMLISGKNRAVASTYFKADATAPCGMGMTGMPERHKIMRSVSYASFHHYMGLGV
jgi:hypothetical protein